jgi:membrane-bound ClpP family serine protease
VTREEEEVMPYRIGVKPSKSVSLLGMIVGAIFIVLGLTLVMPIFGIFGLAWTAIAGAITLYHTYNFFSKRGLSTYEVNIEPERVNTIRK